tara:strand:- start:4143 stop:4565 length:423 start_codon:yes stop_codon:yes gene_type:complete
MSSRHIRIIFYIPAIVFGIDAIRNLYNGNYATGVIELAIYPFIGITEHYINRLTQRNTSLVSELETLERIRYEEKKIFEEHHRLEESIQTLTVQMGYTSEAPDLDIADILAMTVEVEPIPEVVPYIPDDELFVDLQKEWR